MLSAVRVGAAESHPMLVPVYLGDGQVAFVAYSAAVVLVVALDDMLLQFLVHHGAWLCDCCGTLGTLVVDMAEATFLLDGLCPVWIVAFGVSLAVGGHCAENHHCDYHHALNCSLHNLSCFVSRATLFDIVWKFAVLKLR